MTQKQRKTKKEIDKLIPSVWLHMSFDNAVVIPDESELNRLIGITEIAMEHDQ